MVTMLMEHLNTGDVIEVRSDRALGMDETVDAQLVVDPFEGGHGIADEFVVADLDQLSVGHDGGVGSVPIHDPAVDLDDVALDVVLAEFL